MEWLDGEDLCTRLERKPLDDRRDAGAGPPGGRGAGLRARARHRSPRHQAGEPLPPRAGDRPPQGARLRHRAADARGAQADRDRGGGRHARVHGARAGARGSRHQRPRRRLLARLRAVPVPDRPAGVRGRGDHGAARQDPAPGGAADPRGRPQPAARARRRGGAHAGQGPGAAAGRRERGDRRARRSRPAGRAGAGRARRPPPSAAGADRQRAADRLRRDRRSVAHRRAPLAGARPRS